MPETLGWAVGRQKIELGRVEGRHTLRQEGVRTSYMALEAHHSERLRYGHHQEAVGKERMVDKRQAAQVDMENR